MKKIIFSILFCVAVISATAGPVFEYRHSDQESPVKYEIIDGTNTVRTASANVFYEDKVTAYEWWSDTVRVFHHYDYPEYDFNDFPNRNVNNTLHIPSKVQYNGEEYTVTEIGRYSFVKTGASTIYLPSTVKVIREGAFMGDPYKINNIDLGSVEVIEDCAFENFGKNTSPGLNNLFIPASVKTIGKSAFRGNNIQKLHFEEGSNLESIGDYAFYKSQSLNNSEDDNTLVLPSSLKNIGEYAFYQSSNLKKIVFGENLETIGDYAFAWSQALEGVDIPDSVTKIGNGAFYMGIKYNGYIHLGKNISEIGDYAFLNGWVKDLELPASLTKIGFRAFDLQDNHGTSEEDLTDMYVYATVPPEIDPRTFGYPNPNEFAREHWIYYTVCLHVPVGTRQLYKTSPGWENFQCIIDDIADTSSSSMGNIVSYAFTVPSEELNLSDIVGDETWTWEFEKDETFEIDFVDDKKVFSNQYIDLREDGLMKAKEFGQTVVLAYRHDNVSKDPMVQNPTEVEKPTVAAAVIVFVCPTITVVYNTDENPAQQARRKVNEFGEEESGENQSFEDLVNNYATYEHRVVYNSLPKLNIQTPLSVTITKIERGEADKDYNLLDDYTEGLEEITDSKNLIEENGLNYIVPLDPITNNRIIEIYTGSSDKEEEERPGGVVSGVEDVEITAEITVKVSGNSVTVNGAPDDEVITVYNDKGQTVYKSSTKTFMIYRPGVYVATVADGAFKILVK